MIAKPTVTAANPRGAGRPKPDIPPVRVNLILDAETVEKLIKHGKGNKSLAVRLLAAAL